MLITIFYLVLVVTGFGIFNWGFFIAGVVLDLIIGFAISDKT